MVKRRIYYHKDKEIIVYRDTIESLPPDVCVILVGRKWQRDGAVANIWEGIVETISADLEMLKRRQEWKERREEVRPDGTVGLLP